MFADAELPEGDPTLPDEPLDEGEVGRDLLAVVARAQAGGVDPAQALRGAVRALESHIRAQESDS